MIERIADRLVALTLKTHGPRIPANFSSVEKRPKNSPDLCFGTRLEKSDREEGPALLPWTMPTMMPIATNCQDSVTREAQTQIPM